MLKHTTPAFPAVRANSPADQFAPQLPHRYVAKKPPGAVPQAPA